MSFMDPTSLQDLSERLSEQLLPPLKEAIIQEVSRQLSVAPPSKTNDTKFFKDLTEELMGKISSIYQEIHSLQNSALPGEIPSKNNQAKEAAGMVTDASQRLVQIIEQTEKATFEILDRVDRGMETLVQLEKILAQSIVQEDPDSRMIKELTVSLNNDLLGITTGMSFQDLTGQRIKRVIEMLQRVESMTAELYVSTGILLKTRERSPDKDLKQTKEAVQITTSQADVDALLEQLNMG
jgi:chemotaxis protein CheZ